MGKSYFIRIGLRYSLLPLVIVFVSSITKYNDSKNKYLDEYGIKAKDGGLRCGEIIIMLIVSVISKVWLVPIK